VVEVEDENGGEKKGGRKCEVRVDVILIPFSWIRTT
jgi:hypothetical protein